MSTLRGGDYSSSSIAKAASASYPWRTENEITGMSRIGWPIDSGASCRLVLVEDADPQWLWDDKYDRLIGRR